jgi:prevent-host-death family protein
MKLSETVKPISYLKAHASEIVNDMTDTHRTLVITQRGEAKAVLQDVTSYEQTQDSLALLKIVALSLSNIEKGRFKPMRKAFSDLDQKIVRHPVAEGPR